MATTKKVDGQALTGDEANEQAGNIITVEAGESVTAGKVGYIHLTNGEVYVSDTGTPDDIRANGIFLTSGSDGDSVDMLTEGVYTTTGLTAKQDYYLGANGALTTTVGAVRIGTALSTTELLIKINDGREGIVQEIKPWNKSITGGITQLSAYWKECDGSAISDAESPLNGQNLPDTNTTQSFLRGSATSEGTGGGDDHTHSTTTGAVSAGGSQAGGSGSAGAGDQHTHAGQTSGTATNPLPTYVEMVFIMKIK